jgi:mono/diheme cytochrome c family protein
MSHFRSVSSARRHAWIRAIVAAAAACSVSALCVTASSGNGPGSLQPAPSSAGQAAAAGQTVWAGVYNAAQAKRGETLAVQKCVICHGEELLGNEAPGLVGPDFLVHWNAQTAWDLLDRMKTTMPATTPGTLSLQENADILAYVLSLNGFPAGEKELASDMAALSQIRITEKAPPK